MSPWHTCSKCNLYVIGYEIHDCTICRKLNVSLTINTRKYALNLLGIPLPLDLILYISQIASKVYNYEKLLKVDEMVWKARMHGIRSMPDY